MNTWRTSTYTGPNGSNCVEVTAADESVLVRDTKNRVGIILTFAPAAWRRFATALKNGR